MRRSILALILFYPLCTLAQDAPRPDVLSYIEQYRALAVEEMVRTGVPAAIKLAQGIIETQAGTSELVMRSNNHFGIKCKSSWTGDRVHHDDDVYQRDVIILEDIIDTGRTLSQFLPQLHHQQPRSLNICALLHKKEATVHPVEISYLGFTIPDRFVVGYGLDYDGLGRNLAEIRQLSTDPT